MRYRLCRPILADEVGVQICEGLRLTDTMGSVECAVVSQRRGLLCGWLVLVLVLGLLGRFPGGPLWWIVHRRPYGWYRCMVLKGWDGLKSELCNSMLSAGTVLFIAGDETSSAGERCLLGTVYLLGDVFLGKRRRWW